MRERRVPSPGFHRRHQFPGQHSHGTSRKGKKEASKQTANLGDGQRDGGWGDLMGHLFRRNAWACSFLRTKNRYYCQNQENEGHMAKPAHKTAHFILISTEIRGHSRTPPQYPISHELRNEIVEELNLI